MIVDVLFFAYIGFGLGMILRMFTDKDQVCYNMEPLNWWKTALFIVGMALLWPLRFTRLSKGVSLKVKDQDVYISL